MTLCVLQHVETVPSPVEIVERDEQNMDSGEAEGRSLKGCKVSSFHEKSSWVLPFFTCVNYLDV
jgi:hypothetical protein